MKNFLSLLMFTFLTLLIIDLKAQKGVDVAGVKEYNFTTSLPTPVRQISANLLDQMDDKYKALPEFGLLPYDAPCKDCYEIIDKRTSNTRYYVKENSNG
ncbi:MAG: hypothetical protein IPG55_06740 [Saprospiraceae bacterium]|nr:hypothetical protein [Candidatus Defluviibacterium haderslevense]MBK7245675.1 hypothetical protein [Candidatus Defluviibacterium haderslevense]